MSTRRDLDSSLSLRDFIPLFEAPEHLPRRNGKKFHRSAIYRWASAGLAGVKLQTLRIGGELHTHPRWLRAFCDAVTLVRSGS